jgi:hypothetical protein
MAETSERWINSQVASKLHGVPRQVLYLAGLKGEVRSDVQSGCPPRWWEADVITFARTRRRHTSRAAG